MRIFETLSDAAADQSTVLGTASGRGRDSHPALTPQAALNWLEKRSLDSTALVFGNESRGLRRDDIDRCDAVVRIPTVRSFPVLNVTQAIAVLLGYLGIASARHDRETPDIAPHSEVQGLVEHSRQALADIGFLDPANPERIMRQLRRLLARASATPQEVTILRGICRQVRWAARAAPAAADSPIPGRYEKSDPDER